MVRSISIACLLVVAACEQKPASAPVEPARPPTPAAPDEDAPEAAAPEAAVPEAAAPEPAGPLDLSAGVLAPTSTEVLAAVRGVVGVGPAILAPAVEFGPRRYAVAIRTGVSVPNEAPIFVVHAVVLEASTAEPRTWTVLHHHTLVEIDDEMHRDKPGQIPTTVRADDYDDDGAPELLVRMREVEMCGGGGLNWITTLRMVGFGGESGGEPQTALETELHHEIVWVETKAVVSHEDLDGDGHRDVRIRYTTRSEDEAPSVAENRWLWDADADKWTRDPAKAELPSYDRWGCDW